eukprot:CAMPEP_0194596548 /NCGR_PEP_ID=MMETSP0292-20121207/25732_1 /TAXON_ID=39354 /ORGANISM="Heterosigma akashiwo, Strain CCMP2393" /LENGTH=45 /DNA_ID=CAMNT_0039456845 /DNA_START=396 /DNA_END=533 /DNA_ORIENTATION=+
MGNTDENEEDLHHAHDGRVGAEGLDLADGAPGVKQPGEFGDAQEL